MRFVPIAIIILCAQPVFAQNSVLKTIHNSGHESGPCDHLHGLARGLCLEDHKPPVEYRDTTPLASVTPHASTCPDAISAGLLALVEAYKAHGVDENTACQYALSSIPKN